MSAVLSTINEPGYSPDRQIAQLRIPPHSIEGESSVLGGLLLDNSAWDRVGDLLVDTDFYRYEHKMIYDAISGLIAANKPADVVMVYGASLTSGTSSKCVSRMTVQSSAAGTKSR